MGWAGEEPGSSDLRLINLVGFHCLQCQGVSPVLLVILEAGSLLEALPFPPWENIVNQKAKQSARDWVDPCVSNKDAASQGEKCILPAHISCEVT